MEEQLNGGIAAPRYQHIALELASRIASGEYPVGTMIYARSSIASQYGVSPETARRAICVLCDLDIVESEKGSGVTIRSQKNAIEYIEHFRRRQTIDTIKEHLLKSVKQQQREMDSIGRSLTELIDASEHFRSMNPFMPFELKITTDCAYLNKTLSEIQFWQRTGATALAIRKGELIIRSPGPYIALSDGDVLYFLPQDDSDLHVKEFLYPKKQ